MRWEWTLTTPGGETLFVLRTIALGWHVASTEFGGEALAYDLDLRKILAAASRLDSGDPWIEATADRLILESSQ